MELLTDRNSVQKAPPPGEAAFLHAASTSDIDDEFDDKGALKKRRGPPEG